MYVKKHILPRLCLSEGVDDNCFTASSGTHDHGCVTRQHGLIHLNNFISLSCNYTEKNVNFLSKYARVELKNEAAFDFFFSGGGWVFRAMPSGIVTL